MSFIIKIERAGVISYFIKLDKTMHPVETDDPKQAQVFQTLAEALEVKDHPYVLERHCVEVVPLGKPQKVEAVSSGFSPSVPKRTRRQPVQEQRPAFSPKQLAKAAKQTKDKKSKKNK